MTDFRNIPAPTSPEEERVRDEIEAKALMDYQEIEAELLQEGEPPTPHPDM